jgi:hypothetical protein
VTGKRLVLFLEPFEGALKLEGQVNRIDRADEFELRNE